MSVGNPSKTGEGSNAGEAAKRKGAPKYVTGV